MPRDFERCTHGFTADHDSGRLSRSARLAGHAGVGVRVPREVVGGCRACRRGRLRAAALGETVRCVTRLVGCMYAGRVRWRARARRGRRCDRRSRRGPLAIGLLPRGAGVSSAAVELRHERGCDTVTARRMRGAGAGCMRGWAGDAERRGEGRRTARRERDTSQLRRTREWTRGCVVHRRTHERLLERLHRQYRSADGATRFCEFGRRGVAAAAAAAAGVAVAVAVGSLVRKRGCACSRGKGGLGSAVAEVWAGSERRSACSCTARR